MHTSRKVASRNTASKLDAVPDNFGTLMNEQEKAIIRAFARGDQKLREQAIEIHRKYLANRELRNTPEQLFMAEVDTPSPDLLLRKKYREALGA